MSRENFLILLSFCKKLPYFLKLVEDKDFVLDFSDFYVENLKLVINRFRIKSLK
jgi:hypothetical protein